MGGRGDRSVALWVLPEGRRVIRMTPHWKRPRGHICILQSPTGVLLS